MIEIESRTGPIVGGLVAIGAVLGTQVLGWEWGAGQLLPTLIGVGAAGIAILFVYRRYAGAG